MDLSILVIFGVIISVEAWPCVSPIKKVYSRVNADAVLQFSVDLTNLNSPRQFEVKFYNGSIKARITYNSDKTVTTEALPGHNITGDTNGNVVVALPNFQQDGAGVYILTSAGFSTKCNCVYMLGMPRKPKLTVNKTPSVGGSAILACGSTSTTTPSNHSLSLKYSWSVNEIDNPAGPKYSYSPSGNILIVSNILKEDANKHFTCTATEIVSGGYTSSSSEQFSFDVYYGPDSAKVNVTSPYVETEGEEMAMECMADCYPGCTYKWINVTSGKEVNGNDKTLYIKSVDKYMTGDYKCKIENTEISYSKYADVIVSVNIKGSPRPLRKPRENITAVLATPVTLTFVTLAYPKPGPNGFTWYKQTGTRSTQVLSNEDYTIISSGSESNLTILSVSKADFGQYRVSVENSVGSYNQFIFLLRQSFDPICPEVNNAECNCDSKMAIAIVFGVFTFIVTIYAASITMIWKRNVSMNRNQRTTVTMKDTVSGGNSNRQKTYANVSYTPDEPDIQGQLSYSTDSKVVGEDDTSKTQYTDLENFSREKGNSLYDAIKKD